MNVVMMHYHLGQGGVTRVIRSHLEALRAVAFDGRCAVLHGGPADGWREEEPTPTTLVDGLGYDRPDAENLDAGVLAGRLRAALGGLGAAPGDTVLHVHNHALGKNVSWPAALRSLAEEGWPQLLHTHDFAEDFRPANYRRLKGALSSEEMAGLYASAPHVHHAGLTRRDVQVLAGTGLPAARVHLLPNPVTPPFDPAAVDRAAARRRVDAVLGLADGVRLFVYPVRAIRRKNVGEALLWAVLLGGRAHVAVTLAPQNPVERPVYETWTSLAAELALPVTFELGAGVAFADVLAACDRVLTTSVAEGFGLAFLEPWLVDRALAGRDLPEITADFKDEGLDLAALRPRLAVPLDVLGDDGEERCAAAFDRAYSAAAEAFGRTAAPAGIGAHLADGAVDFAALDVGLQAEVVRRTAVDAGCRAEVLAANGWVEAALREVDAEVLAANAAVARQRYSLAACGERLRRIYGALTARRGPVEPPPRPEAVLESFLDPARFHPVRTA